MSSVDLECLRNECGQSVAALQIADIYGLFDCRSASDTVASYLTLALDTAARSQNAFLQIKNQFRVDKTTKQQRLKQTLTFFNFIASLILCCFSNWSSSLRFRCEPRNCCCVCCCGRLLDRDRPRDGPREFPLCCGGFCGDVDPFVFTIIEKRSFNVSVVDEFILLFEQVRGEFTRNFLFSSCFFFSLDLSGFFLEEK